MKQPTMYLYSEEQVSKLYSYLVTRPMAEVELLVATLRSPLNANEIKAAQTAAAEATQSQPATQEATNGEESQQASQ